ncbi:MAG: ABC transporter permease subunit/CPBP intramembrane protease [Planctomycetota bacterium]
MRWPKAKLIFQREVRDQLRDRRTLFMIFVLPVLLYPALGLGMVQLTLKFGQEEKKIGLVGAKYLPAKPPLVDASGKHFDKSLFHFEQNQPYYRVLEREDWTKQSLLDSKIDVLIVVPAATNQLLEKGWQAHLHVMRNGINDNSEAAYRAVLSILDRWEEKIVADRMSQLGKGVTFADPIQLGEEQSDISAAADRSGTAWGKVFPFLLVLMALTGAFYPAIDLCAGEKERGTMETLLITPAARGEIVLGKFLTIFLFSVATTIFNLSSMGLTFAQIANLAPLGAGERFTPPTFQAICWMLILMLPLAGFFSALCMALAVFARSTKEGQYYLMPMFLVVTPLIFLTLVPGVELNPFYSLVPVTNVALLLRALMLNQYETAMVYLLPVLIPTVLYGYLALRYAVEQFHREDVLFREAERFSVGIWIRHLLRDKEALPTVGEAWFCYVFMLLLRWYTTGRFPINLDGQVASQLVLIGFPPVVMALLLTQSARRTLSLCMPRVTPLLLAIPLAVCLHPVAVAWSEVLKQYYPVSDEVTSVVEQITKDASHWTLFLALALVPAICEEVAFRGFILAGLRRKHPAGRAIVISSVLFGIFHMVPQQMLNASALGLILGLFLVRSGSLFPAMLFHVTHNGLMVLRDVFGLEQLPRPNLWIGLGMVGTVALLVLLYRLPNADDA